MTYSFFHFTGAQRYMFCFYKQVFRAKTSLYVNILSVIRQIKRPQTFEISSYKKSRNKSNLFAIYRNSFCKTEVLKRFYY